MRLCWGSGKVRGGWFAVVYGELVWVLEETFGWLVGGGWGGWWGFLLLQQV